MSSDDKPNQTEGHFIEDWLKEDDAEYQADEKVHENLPEAHFYFRYNKNELLVDSYELSTIQRPTRNKQRPKYLNDFI